MSSANRVRVAYIKETAYGVTPTATVPDPWRELRKTSESLSGTPSTTESAEARTDRQSAGQITTGLEVKGNVEAELAGSICFKDMLLAGTKFDNSNTTHGYAGTAGTWGAVIEDDVEVTIAFTPKAGVELHSHVTLTATNATTFTDIVAEFSKVGKNRVKGHILQIINTGGAPGTLTGLSGKNKKCIYIPRGIIFSQGSAAGAAIGTVTSSSIIGFAKDMANEAGKLVTLSSPEIASIGVLDISYTLEKRFTDLTGPTVVGGAGYVKTIVYRGALVDVMSMNFAYGEIAKASFSYVANDHETPLVPLAPLDSTAPILLTAPEAHIALNASVDVGLVIVDDMPTAYCIQSLSVELNNNSKAQNCIGSIAPEKYTQGSAAIKVTMTAYLEDSNWEYLDKKIKSTPIQVMYYALNQDGGVGVNIPDLQLSFDDPNATGKDAIVELSISGTAKVTTKPVYGGNSMFVYWLKPTG